MWMMFGMVLGAIAVWRFLHWIVWNGWYTMDVDRGKPREPYV